MVAGDKNIVMMGEHLHYGTLENWHRLQKISTQCAKFAPCSVVLSEGRMRLRSHAAQKKTYLHFPHVFFKKVVCHACTVFGTPIGIHSWVLLAQLVQLVVDGQENEIEVLLQRKALRRFPHTRGAHQHNNEGNSTRRKLGPGGLLWNPCSGIGIEGGLHKEAPAGRGEHNLLTHWWLFEVREGGIGAARLTPS